MEILLNGRPVEELSTIVNVSKSVKTAKKMCEKLLNVIPRQQFLISIQARIGSKILARENLQSLRKDVTGHLVIFLNITSISLRNKILIKLNLVWR
jgi:translation elongation factor EF-4